MGQINICFRAVTERLHLRSVETHLLVEAIAAKLYCRVWHNSNTVCSISAHEAPPSLVPPHFGKAFSHRELVFLPANTLNLEKDLETFQRRDDRPGNSTGYSSGAERGHHRLCDDLAEMHDVGSIFRLDDVALGLCRV